MSLPRSGLKYTGRKSYVLNLAPCRVQNEDTEDQCFCSCWVIGKTRRSALENFLQQKPLWSRKKAKNSGLLLSFLFKSETLEMHALLSACLTITIHCTLGHERRSIVHISVRSSKIQRVSGPGFEPAMKAHSLSGFILLQYTSLSDLDLQKHCSRDEWSTLLKNLQSHSMKKHGLALSLDSKLTGCCSLCVCRCRLFFEEHLMA